MSLCADLKQTIHRTDPFVAFEAPDLEYDVQGWFGHIHVTDAVLEEFKPQVMIEVGTWKGQSAIHFAKRMRGYHEDCALICIDTWLGSRELWQKEHSSLNCRNGLPDVYRQFMVNVLLGVSPDHRSKIRLQGQARGNCKTVSPCSTPMDFDVALRGLR